MRIGILYICTGNYQTFWKSFHRTAEKYFLLGRHEIHYFVFTDSQEITSKKSSRVHTFYQEPLPWPLITLYRFKIFQTARDQLEKMDALYFFNANMIFFDSIGDEILPDEDKPLVFLRHPLMDSKERDQFTYDRNPECLAYIPYGQGNNYFMGALNGGTREAYLSMIDQLQDRIAADEKRGIIALWHDESHLNWYAFNHPDKIKPLDPSFGYPEGRNLSFPKRIVIRDKNRLGGHAYLRGLSEKKPWYKRLLNSIRYQK